jgi:WD40 repeat protein
MAKMAKIAKIAKMLAILLCFSIIASACTPLVPISSKAGNLEPLQQTVLYLDPPSTTVLVCTNFTVAIMVADVIDLYAWQAEIHFDPNLLEIVGYSFGPFLPPPTVMPPPIIDNVAGYILAGDVRMFPPGQSGSGALFYIRFHCKGAGECDLTFFGQNTFLLNSYGEYIQHTQINAFVSQIELYWKPEYPDYAPSGMPDIDQRQDYWYDPASGQWVFCGPVAVANSLWWLDSEFEPGTTPPPTVSDGFNLVTSYGYWDDHDVKNVEPLVNDLAMNMMTSPGGTEVHDMKRGIDQYLTAKGMHAYFYTHLYKQPTFEEVEIEVEKCQDVVLLLGFWQYDPYSGAWYRFGGHYVTVAGINSTQLTIAFSDPYIDAAEMGFPGRVLPPGHPPGHAPDLHNDTLYVSHDIYWAAMGSPSPGGTWGFPDYNPWMLGYDLFFNFERINFPTEYEPYFGPFNPEEFVYTEVEYAVVTSPWFAKGQYEDYAPSGMPDFDEKQDGWINPWPPQPGSWSYCGPAAVGNSLWWFDSKYERNPVTPPNISDSFPLVQAYGPWDDHDPQNVGPYLQSLAWYMDTDGQRTSPYPYSQHCGTDVFDMQAGIAHYLSDQGVNPLGDANGDGVVNNIDVNIVLAALGSTPGASNWDMRADVVHDNVINPKDQALVAAHFGEKWGKFYEKTMKMPEFEYISHQIKMCEDVVLLLGFWQEFQPGYFVRIGGHFVTAHGIDEADMIIAISDPMQDNAENGGQGRVIPGWPHGHPPVPPDTIHNDAMYVSHDYYKIAPSPSPGGRWGLLDYNWSSIVNNFWGQNTPHNFTEEQEPWMGMPVYVEIEYAVVVSCRGPMVVGGSEDGNVYALDHMGNLLWIYGTQAPVVSVAMSEWGEYIVAGSLNNGLFVFNSTGSLLWSKAIPIAESYGPGWAGADSKSVGISADGSYIIAATWGGLYLYDNAGNQIWLYSGGPDPSETCAKISPDGRYIVCTSYTTGQIHFFSHLRDGVAGWQPTDGSPIWTQMPLIWFFNWVAIDGCGRYVAFTADLDGDLFMEVYLFDRAGTQIWSWENNATGYVRVDMPWDGRGVVAVNDDPSDIIGAQAVYFSDMKDGAMGWQAADGTPQWNFIPTPPAGTQDFYTVAISADGKVIATGPGPNNIYLLDNTGTQLQTIPNGALKTLDLTFTGEYGAAGELSPVGGGTIDFFSKTRNTLLWSFPVGGKVHSVAIQKKYPCLMPFPYHDVDVSNITRYTTSDGKVKTIVCQGYPANEIKVELSNHGNYTEIVEVTLYAYSSSTNTIVVVGSVFMNPFLPGTGVWLITWFVPSWLPYYGNYTLHATIGPVQDENYLVDNEFIDSGLLVTGPGDITGDRKVDGKDVAIISKGYGSITGQPKYAPNGDINCDYKIDGKDLAVVSKNYGKTYP